MTQSHLSMVPSKRTEVHTSNTLEPRVRDRGSRYQFIALLGGNIPHSFLLP